MKPRILLVHNTEPEDNHYNQQLVNNLRSFAEVDERNYALLPPNDAVESVYHGLVISGAPVHYPYSAIDDRLLDFQQLLDISLPVLGICMGHQNIARLHGARLIADSEAENSQEPIQILSEDPLFDGVVSGDLVAAHHHCSVSLPDNFIALAQSSRCRNQSMRHSSKPLYGVQFHAELTEAGIRVLKNFVMLAAAWPSLAYSSIEASDLGL